MPFSPFRPLLSFAALSCAVALAPLATAQPAAFAAVAKPDAAGNLWVKWPSTAGARYVLESSPDLATWTVVPGEFTGDGAELATIVSPAGATGANRLFWRVAALATAGGPAVYESPAPRTVAVGLPASFRVVAAGAEPMSYQWLRNGQPIASAASAWYTTDLASAADNGATFSVTITNVSGSRTTAPVALTVVPPPSDPAATRIDTAQRSGVTGFPFAIWGSGFGSAGGTVRILGATATVTAWSDTLIKAIVPPVATGAGQLVVQTARGTAQSPFIVYAIDPQFLLKPIELENLTYGRPVVIDGTYTYWTYSGTPPTFLTHNIGNGTARIDVAPVPTLAVDLGESVSGPAFFTFQSGGSWYENDGPMPRDYTVEASGDSTDGKNGQWTVLATITGNSRNTRLHPVTFSGQRWLRWRVTASASGAAFHVNEFRLFRPKAGSTGPGWDAFGLIGDSNMANDFGYMYETNLWNVLRALKADGTQPITQIMGMSGQNSGALRFEAAASPYSVATAMQLQPELRYIGIALGTNGAGDDWMGFQIRENYEQGIQQILAAGKVPLLARLPDTRNWGTPAGKRRAVAYADDLAAQYRLIPGPDGYSTFREHLAEYLSDDVHHSDAGRVAANRLWAEALMRSGIYAAAPGP